YRGKKPRTWPRNSPNIDILGPLTAGLLIYQIMAGERTMESRPLKGVVADEIRNRIIVGALSFGERGSEKHLATELPITRTPAREAILQLQSEGLIVVRPRSGTFVFDLSAEDLRQICDLRGLFEAGAIRMGAHQHERMISALTARVAEAALALEAG